MLDEQIIPLLSYLDGKITKYAKPIIAGSYIKLVRSRTKTKVAAFAKNQKSGELDFLVRDHESYLAGQGEATSANRVRVCQTSEDSSSGEGPSCDVGA